MNALERLPFENTPLDLKRLGKFDQALHEYARYYAEATELDDSFLKEQCFEQMFDLVLLKLYRQQEQSKSQQAPVGTVSEAGLPIMKGEENLFKSSQELRQTVAYHLRQLLVENQSFRQEAFDKALAKCWQKFSPRGRGRNPFSVDSQWLVSVSGNVKKVSRS